MIIVKNGEKTIAKCLDSLLSQTRVAEVIVVDGNSTDATRDIVSSFPVKLILAPKQDTYGTSRNLGVKHARGDMILFMDADDYANPTWCERLTQHFKKDPSVGIVTCPRTPPPDSDGGWFLQMLRLKWSGFDRKSMEAHLIDWTSVTTKGSAFLKDAIIRAGWFDEDMFFGTEDKELAYRIQRLGYKVLHEPSEVIFAEPVRGIRNYLKDSFSREGIGHGYFRRRHGHYRPPLGGVGPLVLLLGAIFVYMWQPILVLPILGGVVLSLRSFIVEGTYLHRRAKRRPIVFAFMSVRWLGRVLGFFGFILGFLIPVQMLHRAKGALQGTHKNSGK